MLLNKTSNKAIQNQPTTPVALQGGVNEGSRVSAPLLWVRLPPQLDSEPQLSVSGYMITQELSLFAWREFHCKNTTQ